MNLGEKMRGWRDWFPVPTEEGGFQLVRWVLLDAHRLAVTGSLLTAVFGAFILVGTTWTFEMQRLLTETDTVQTLLDTFLSGMILLVSIVVSINSIVLSHDMSSVQNQEDRIKGAAEFRRDLDDLAEPEDNPSNPASFLRLLSRIISERARLINDEEILSEHSELTEDIRKHASKVATTAEQLGDVDDTTGAEFAVLWKGMKFPYGRQMEDSRQLRSALSLESDGELVERLDYLIEAFKLFAIGKEYFKTLYYTQEVSRLSQTLLIITLPAILVNSSTILAINAGLFPDFWFLGLPPLQIFVAATFTVSLAPYLVLTAYTLRLATVARLTSSAGIFSLN